MPPLSTAADALAIANNVLYLCFGMALGLALAAVLCLFLLREDGEGAVLYTWNPGEEEIALITERVRRQLATLAATPLPDPQSRQGDRLAEKALHSSGIQRVVSRDPLGILPTIKHAPAAQVEREGCRSAPDEGPNRYPAHR